MRVLFPCEYHHFLPISAWRCLYKKRLYKRCLYKKACNCIFVCYCIFHNEIVSWCTSSETLNSISAFIITSSTSSNKTVWGEYWVKHLINSANYRGLSKNLYPWHNWTPSISNLWNRLKPYKKPFPINCINSDLLHNWYYFCYNFIIVIINVTFPIIISYYYLLCHIYRYLLPYYLFCPTQIKN